MHVGDPVPLSTRVGCQCVIYVGTPVYGDRTRDVDRTFLVFSVGPHTHPPPPITTAQQGLLVTALEIRTHHHITLAAEEAAVRNHLAEEYGRVASAVPRPALQAARRHAASERHPWGQGRDAALRMVTRCLAAGGRRYYRAPMVSPDTGYIFPCWTDSVMQAVASRAVAIETDAYYKAVERVGFQQEGRFIVLGVSVLLDNKCLGLARFFIEKETRLVYRACYLLLFQEMLRVDPKWAPWHVHVQRHMADARRRNPALADADARREATTAVAAMSSSLLVAVTSDFSTALTGGLCDALVEAGFSGFTADEHARHLMVGCRTHAHRVCLRAPESVRLDLRTLMSCHDVAAATLLRDRIVAREPGRACAGVVGNPRLLAAFCPAFSAVSDVQRSIASSTTNMEESQHERLYRLTGKHLPLLQAMASVRHVDEEDADGLQFGRGQGATTTTERCVLAEKKRTARAHTETEADQSRGGSAPGGPTVFEVLDGDDGDVDVVVVPVEASDAQKRRRTSRQRRTVASAATSTCDKDLRIAQLEAQVLRQENELLRSRLSQCAAGASQPASLPRVGGPNVLPGAACTPPPPPPNVTPVWIGYQWVLP